MDREDWRAAIYGRLWRVRQNSVTELNWNEAKIAIQENYNLSKML